MTVNKKDPNISDKHKQPDSIEVAAYPALSESVLLGPGAIMPLGAALRQMQKMPFWKGKDIRIHREELNVFFYPEI